MEKENLPYLQWQQRPANILQAIDDSFTQIVNNKKSMWGLYNGSSTYDFLNISQLALARKIIEDAHKLNRPDVYILDSGAGNFQSCNAFAEYINDHQFVLPHDITVHIIGTRGESYEGEVIESKGICKIYKFGSFKIESHVDEFRKRGLELEKKIDLTISRWANRHYVDPLGTFLQFYHTTRPQSGFLIMDWCYYLYEKDSFENKVMALNKSRSHLFDILKYIKAPFLLSLKGDGYSKEVDHFIFKRENNDSLKLPLAYESIEECNRDHFDIGSSRIVRFKILDSSFKAKKLQSNVRSMFKEMGNAAEKYFWGDIELLRWFDTNKLIIDTSFSSCQFFQIKKGEEEITPLYTPQEVIQREDNIVKKIYHSSLVEEDIIIKKKKFFSQLKGNLPKEISPVSTIIVNGVRGIEHDLSNALKCGNFQIAQCLINEGAEVNRVFGFREGFFNNFLDLAVQKEFPKGTIDFLLSNGANTEETSLDNALYCYVPSDEIKLLVEYGVQIKDINLALYRAISRSELDLIDLFIAKGGNVNSFINGLPLIYGALDSPKIWNELIDRGAKGTHDQTLSKRIIA